LNPVLCRLPFPPQERGGYIFLGTQRRPPSVRGFVYGPPLPPVAVDLSLLSLSFFLRFLSSSSLSSPLGLFVEQGRRGKVERWIPSLLSYVRDGFRIHVARAHVAVVRTAGSSLLVL